MNLDYDQAIARRQELIELIAACADEIASIDADLHQAEPVF